MTSQSPTEQAALAQGSAAVERGETVAEVSHYSSMVAGAALASRGGPVGLLAFSAGVAGGMAGAQLAAAIHADNLAARGLQAVGMHAIGQPSGPFTDQTGAAGHNVATVGHQVAHSFAVAGFLAAIAVGVAVAALVVATAGVGAVALIGAAAAGGFAGGFLGSALGGGLGQMGARTGIILTGSPDVFANGKPVARVTDLVQCAKEPAPVAIIEGNPTILVNGLMLTRVGHKLLCGAVIDEGCPDVLANEASEAIATPQPEVPVWMRVMADWAGFLPLGAVAARMANKLPGSKSAQIRGGQPCANRTCATDPVDVATGEWIEQRQDIALPGVLPLQLNRTYASAAALPDVSAAKPGLFGPRWADSFSVSLTWELAEESAGASTGESAGESAATITYWDEQGTGWVFDTPHESIHAAHLGQPDWRLSGTRSQPVLRNLRTGTESHFVWVGSHAHLTRVQDGYGNHWQFDYVGAQLVRIRHSAGFYLTLERQAVSASQHETESLNGQSGSQAHSQLSITLFDQGAPPLELARYQFDAEQRLIGSQSEFSGQLYYRYDQAHRATGWGDASQTHVQLHYDPAGRVCRVDTPNGIHGGTLEYDIAARATRVTQNGEVTLYRYNAANLVTEIINPLGQRSQTEWNAFGQKQSQTDARGRRSEFFYSQLGQLTQFNDPDGLITRIEYNDDGQRTKVQAPDGRRWRWQYNPQGGIVQVDTPTGSEQFAYAADGCLIEHRQNGTVTRFDYDDFQRPCAQIAANGALTQWQQSRLGRMHQITDAKGQTTHFDYFTESHAPDQATASAPRKGLHLTATGVRLPNGDDTASQFDAEGLLCQQTNAAGHTRHWQWGAYDLLHSQTDAAGYTYHYQYDHAARLCQITNPLGQHWKWQYDAAGQLLEEQDFAGRSTTYQYDPAGRLTSKTAADWVQTRYLYDHRERVCRIETEDCTIQYAWDQFNRLVEARVSRDGKLESELNWAYDEAGRVIGSVQDEQCLSWHYNQQGLCTSRSSMLETVHYQHDQQGWLSQLRVGNGELHIERDIFGQEVRRTSLPGQEWRAIEQGSMPFQSHFHLQQQFDSIGRLREQSLSYQMPNYVPDFPGQVEYRSQLRYYRWGQGRLLGIDDTRFGDVRYQRDARDQIIRTDYARGQVRGGTLAQESFTYNATSDIEWRDLASAGQLHQAAQPFAQTHQHGTVTTRGHLHYRHDACGRMVERTELRNGFRPQTTYFKWDGFDRLVQAHCADGAIWRYSYDAFGRRTGKRCIQPARGSAHHAPSQRLQQESYLWDGATLAQQSKRYADGREEHLSWHYAPGSFTPLAVSHQTGDGTSRLLYVVADQLGTPRELVNAAGQVVWAAQLQTWGKLNHQWQQGAANDAETVLQLELRFPNQWHDAETGLHYNYQRYYEPELGQYCSPDPIGVAGGLRPQGYVHDPAGWCDPLGLAGCGGGQSAAGKNRGGGRNPAGQLSYDAVTASWTSPGGLVYGQGSVHGNRILHVLDHTIPNPSKPVHSVFNVDRNQVIGLIDEAWAARTGPGTLQSNGNRVWLVGMNRPVGVGGQTTIQLVTRDGTTQIITAFPI